MVFLNKPHSFELVVQEFGYLVFRDRVRHEDQTNVVLFAKLLLDEVAILLILKTISVVLMHHGIVVVVLRPIIFHRQF